MDEEKEQLYHSEYEKRLQGLSLLDDDFMRLVFDRDTASTGQLLQVILDMHYSALADRVRYFKETKGRERSRV